MEITKARQQRFPRAPGVYTFTKRGKPIYIGKAANLYARLLAYKPGGGWKEAMLAEATGLTVTRTNSEMEALLLESALIHKHQPKYNVLARDDKQPLYVLITTDEDFPQVLPTRSHRRSGTYFGPFTSARAVRETFKALRRVFPYRCGSKPIPPTPSRSPSRMEGEKKIGQPCLYFHLGLCVGTCAGRITKTAYRRQVIAPLLRLLRGETMAARARIDREHRALLDSVLAHTRVLATVEQYAVDAQELQRALGLPHPPHRVEGYDISNIHGLEAVGSMVVAIDGEPETAEYKRFKIRALEGKSNDPAMMGEVIARRIAHLRADGAGKGREEWPAPDLMVIDGGKAQLNAALRAMRGAGVVLPIVALAKRNEELYLSGERAPLVLPKHSPALHLLQRVRDEAHRFAIAYHRKRYRKRMLHG